MYGYLVAMNILYCQPLYNMATRVSMLFAFILKLYKLIFVE